MGLASRKLGVPVRWIEDRLEHLAASSSSSGRVTACRSGVHVRGELVALRYDAIEDVGAYVRAPEPATLYRMHGSLAGAYRVQNVAARNRVVLTNTMPSGLNRGFGGPQLYLALERTMTIAANRLGLDPAELRRRNLDPGRRLPVPHAVGCSLRLRRLRGLSRRRARRSRSYDERRAEAEAARTEGRLVGVGMACVVEPSISNMGYITLAEPAEERGLPKSGNAEGCTIAISALGGITVHTATTPQGQGHRTVIAQVVADRLGVEPSDVDVLTEVDTSTSPWTIASGNYSSRFSGVGVGAVGSSGRAARGEDRCDPGASRGRECVSAPRRRHRALEPRGAPARNGAGARCDRLLRGAEPPPARRGRPGRVLRVRTASSPTSPSWRWIATRAKSPSSTTSPSTMRGAC